MKIRFKLLVFTLFSICSLLSAQTYLLNNVAGQRHYGYSGDGGPATNAHLTNPMGVYSDNSGNIYISDWGNARLREVTPDGIIITIAGNGVYGFSGDGGPATSAELGGSMGIFVDNAGDIYLADIGNERIRKIDKNGIINTIAGNGTYGFSGDGGPAINAAFEDPAGICGDTSGNIFVADEFNNKIREITKNGNITTVAGCGVRGYSGDGGPAMLAEFYYPSGVAVDKSGNIFIADEDNNCIRKVSNGIISTIAGNGIAGYSGDGGSANLALLSNSAGIGVDNIGNIFITDGFNNRIRVIDKNGIIRTIAGNGIPGYSGVGDTATIASLYNPVSIAADTSGNLFFANAFNNFIQKLSPLPEVILSASIVVYPNPTQGIFTVKIKNFTASLRLEVYNVLGERVSYQQLNTLETQINLTGNSKGIYLYRVLTSDNTLFASGKLALL